MRIQILMKYFEKRKWWARSDLKRHESEKNIRSYVSKRKSSRKKKKKGFCALSMTSSLNSTTQIISRNV